MRFHDELTTDFSKEALQEAFRNYYGELGVRVTDWEGLFAEMSDGADRVCVRRDEAGKIVGFLMLVTSDEASAWRGFFTTKLGCVEEFWVAPEHRRQGHGTALLRLAEELFLREGCGYAILTTDTAPDFYRRHGYCLQKGIRARNGADVYVKALDAACESGQAAL